MRLLDRNWRCPLGEIDLVALDGGCLVVAEVKTRRSAGCGTPAEAVTPAKLARLRRLTAAWLQAQEQGFAEVRIDVLDVVCPDRGAARVTHLRGVG
jgi:putative endonuclease